MAQFTQTSLTRTCTLCNETKFLTEFYRDARNQTGYRYDCKACCIERDRRRLSDPDKKSAYAAYQAEYREVHREKARATTAAYRAANPERVRIAQERWRSDPKNQQIARQRAREFRLANPERRDEYHRRRRANKLAHSIGFIEPAVLAAKIAYWGKRCWMCGSRDKLTIDHVKPLSRGGAHALANLRPACRRCNGRKRDRWPVPDLLGVLRCSGSRSPGKTSSATWPATSDEQAGTSDRS